MADFIFLFHGKLGHGLSEFRQEEKGVVAEAAFALVEITNDPFAGAFAGQGLTIGPTEGHHAGIVSFAIITTVWRQVFDELLVIRFIIAVMAGIPGRVDAGLIAQSAGYDAGIVGEHREVDGLGIVVRLLQCILCEGGAGLFGLRHIGHLGNRHSVPADFTEGLLKFPNLPLVMGG